MSKIAIIAQFKVKPEHYDDFMERIKTHGAASREEPGCEQFDIVVPTRGENQIMLYELYKDQAAFDFHASTDRIKAHGAATKEMLEERKIHVCELVDSGN